MLGDLLDNRYRIIRTLSKGGFGQTYIAEDTRRPGCPRCVMKHLKPVVLDPAHFSNARRLFHTEAIALEKLGHHPQIPRLLAYFEENNDFYLVQDLIRGYPLTKELKAGFRWLEADIYQLLHDVLSILIYVHDRGVIHRDIKPDNIIRRQLDRALVLVDFGSVKQIRNPLHPNPETGHTISIGTVGYMSTEQAHGRPRPNSDLYSLGIIGIQAATGIKPKNFQEDDSTGELVWRHQAHVSDELACFLERMVAYHFKDRYLDAREALRALKRIRPDGTPRYAVTQADPLLAKPSYWSLTASRLATAITSLRPDFRPRPPSPPTFIELPEPTEISGVEDDVEAKDSPRPHPTHLMPYSAPQAHGGADATTADFENSTALGENHGLLGPLVVGTVDEAIDADANVRSSAHQGDVSSKWRMQDEVSQNSEQSRPVRQPRAAVMTVNDSRGQSWEDPLATVPLTLSSRALSWRPMSVALKATGRQVALLCCGQQRSLSRTSRILWCITAGLTLTVLTGVGGGYGYQRFQKMVQVRSAFQSMQQAQDSEKYETCQKTAQNLSVLYAHAIPQSLTSLGYECALQLAEQRAQNGKLEEAIAIASSIPSISTHRLVAHDDSQVSTDYFRDAQKAIRIWYATAWESAAVAYDQGNRKRALDIAAEIPSDHPLQSMIQLSLLKWSAEEKLWIKARDHLDLGNWQQAIDIARPLLKTSPHFEARVEALINEAEVGIQLDQQEPDVNIQLKSEDAETGTVFSGPSPSATIRPSSSQSPQTSIPKKPKP